MHRVGHEFVQQELGLLGHEHGFLRDVVLGEVFLDFRQVPFDRDDVLLQEACKIAGDVLVNAAEGGFRCLGHGEYTVHCLNRGLGGFFLSGHRHHTESVVVRGACSGCPPGSAGSVSGIGIL